MANQKPVLIDIDEFIADGDLAIANIQAAQRDAKKAKKLAVDGQVPLRGGGHTWDTLKHSAHTIRGAFRLSDKVIKDYYESSKTTTGLIALLLLGMIAAFGWEFDQRREFLDNGMVTNHHFVKVLSFEMPPYRSDEPISRAEYTRERLAAMGHDLGPDNTVHGIKDGKVVTKIDGSDQQSVAITRDENDGT